MNASGWDSYRRFISLFGEIVLKISSDLFSNAMEGSLKKERNATYDTTLSSFDLQGLVETFKRIIEDNFGKPIPNDPYEQLFMAIEAVFASWNGKRAADYRREFRIIPEIANGTAVNVQAMVFVVGEQSATGGVHEEP